MPWIHHTTPPAPKPGLTLKEHATGSLTADGSEQTVTEASLLMKLSGYVDLSNMEAGDEVVIRQYMRVEAGGSYKKYGQATYIGVQDPPLVYITTKVLGYGGKVTLEQIAGVLKTFDYSFVREE